MHNEPWWANGMGGLAGMNNPYAGYASQPGVSEQLQAMAQRTPYDHLYARVRELEAKNKRLEEQIDRLLKALCDFQKQTHLQKYAGGPNG